MAYNIVLYGSGLFGRNVPSQNQQQLTAIKNSGFTTVILWTIHVWPSGDLVYNNTVIATNGEFVNQYSFLPHLVNDLKTGGTVNKVFFCIGSGGASDFAAIKSLLATDAGKQTLQKNFGALVTAMPIDGFDFDLEESPICDYTDTVVELTLMLNNLFGMMITYCPYYDEECQPNVPFWENCLAEVYTQNNNTQAVSWYNLQCYEGGAGNNPADWVNRISTYGQPLGITDAAAFVIPGYWSANPGTNCQSQPFNGVLCPNDMQAKFHALKQPGNDPGINGGFVWNSGDIFTCEAAGQCGGPVTPQAYAQAIINGLNMP